MDPPVSTAEDGMLHCNTVVVVVVQGELQCGVCPKTLTNYRPSPSIYIARAGPCWGNLSSFSPYDIG